MYVWGEELEFLGLYGGDEIWLEDRLFVEVELWLFVDVEFVFVIVCLCEILYFVFVCYSVVWEVVDIVDVCREEIGVGFDY